MKPIFVALVLFLLIAVPQQVSALSAAIGSPEFGYKSGISEEQKEKINALLKFMREELEFVDGMFFNEYSHQNYNGTSEKVGEFLALLEKNSPEPVTVEFRDLDEKLAFRLNQVESKTTVTVNSARDDFRLKDFKAYLKGLKPAPAVKKEKDKTLSFLHGLKPDFKAAEDPEKIGRDLANEDLRNDLARVFHIGKPWSADQPLIDHESGLVVTIAAGCTAGAEAGKIVSGYNAVMREKAGKKK